MSLGSLASKVKQGGSALTSVSGMKSTAMHLAIGASVGAIVSLVMHYIQLFVINKYLTQYAKFDGFSIYPNAATQSIYVEDIVLILATVGMLFTKKLWLTIGFFLGWYGSNYLGFYTALHLPTPATSA
jgi:hypothetical protein